LVIKKGRGRRNGLVLQVKTSKRIIKKRMSGKTQLPQPAQGRREGRGRGREEKEEK
jgi:hypothetical protein